MKRLVIFLLFVLAAWYGYHHYREIFEKVPKNEAVVHNNSGETLTRVRLTVGGQTFVREEMAADERVTFSFALKQDSKFKLDWLYAAKINEGHWTGGGATAGPKVSRYVFTVQPDADVSFEIVDLSMGVGVGSTH